MAISSKIDLLFIRTILEHGVVHLDMLFVHINSCTTNAASISKIVITRQRKKIIDGQHDQPIVK